MMILLLLEDYYEEGNSTDFSPTFPSYGNSDQEYYYEGPDSTGRDIQVLRL